MDLRPFNETTSTPEQRQSAATSLVEACHSLGFVAIRNIGIEDTLLQEAFDWSKKLFALSMEDKMKAPHPPSAMPHRGYSAPGVEKVYSNDEAGTDGSSLREISDFKESYEIGSDNDPQQTNIWLPDDVLPGFRAFTTRFYWACDHVADQLLRALADGLKLHKDERERLLKLNSHNCNQLRLLHYPTVEADSLRANVVARMPAHTDWGSCTMLFQDRIGGLELQDPNTEEWVPAQLPSQAADDCVVNVGDFMERLTNGE